MENIVGGKVGHPRLCSPHCLSICAAERQSNGGLKLKAHLYMILPSTLSSPCPPFSSTNPLSRFLDCSVGAGIARIARTRTTRSQSGNRPFDSTSVVRLLAECGLALHVTARPSRWERYLITDRSEAYFESTQSFSTK